MWLPWRQQLTKNLYLSIEYNLDHVMMLWKRYTILIFFSQNVEAIFGVIHQRNRGWNTLSLLTPILAFSLDIIISTTSCFFLYMSLNCLEHVMSRQNWPGDSNENNTSYEYINMKKEVCAFIWILEIYHFSFTISWTSLTYVKNIWTLMSYHKLL